MGMSIFNQSNVIALVGPCGFFDMIFIMAMLLLVIMLRIV